MLIALALALTDQPVAPFGGNDFNTIKLTVGVNLKDDDSARYKLQQPIDDNVYCGWVNAKNSYGAYTGWRPFVISYIKFDDQALKVFMGPFFYNEGETAPTDFLFAECEQAGFNLYNPPAISDN